MNEYSNAFYALGTAMREFREVAERRLEELLKEKADGHDWDSKAMFMVNEIASKPAIASDPAENFTNDVWVEVVTKRLQAYYLTGE